MDLPNVLPTPGVQGQDLPPTGFLPEGQQAAPSALPPSPAAVNPEIVAQVQHPDAPDFFTKLRTDPAMTQAMLMMGARLMQGPRNGQDELGALGDAAMIGLTAHNFSKENERQAGIQNQELDLKKAESGAKVAASQANTAHTVQKTGQEKELFPEEQKKIAAEIKRLRSAGDKEGALALQAQWKADPKRMAEEWNADLGRTRAQTNASNASAANANASASYQGARAAAAGELLASGEAAAVLHGTRGGAGAAKEKLAEIKTYLKAAHPEMTDQQIAQEVIGMQTGKKGEGVEMLVKLQDSEDKNIRKWASQQLAAMAGYKEGGVAPVQAGAPAPARAALPPKEKLVTGQNYPGYGTWSGTGFKQ
jgi:hypothetical protein